MLLQSASAKRPGKSSLATGGPLSDESQAPSNAATATAATRSVREIIRFTASRRIAPGTIVLVGDVCSGQRPGIAILAFDGVALVTSHLRSGV